MCVVPNALASQTQELSAAAICSDCFTPLEMPDPKLQTEGVGICNNPKCPGRGRGPEKAENYRHLKCGGNDFQSDPGDRNMCRTVRRMFCRPCSSHDGSDKVVIPCTLG